MIICILFILIHNSPLTLINQGSDSSNDIIDVKIPSEKIFKNLPYSSKIITIHATKPEAPSTVPLYKGILCAGDNIDLTYDKLLKKRENVTSAQDAPEIAKQRLKSYGGLPLDSELIYSNTTFVEKFEPTTGETIENHPVYTEVSYHRKINGFPVVGYCDEIKIDLGENGKIIKINKLWRTLKFTGENISIISLNMAIEKLQNGEIINPPVNSNDLFFHTIMLGYYENSRTDPEILLQPVWIFSGTDSLESPLYLIVDAQKYSNTTPIQVSIHHSKKKI
jgi:hypothetical protein